MGEAISRRHTSSSSSSSGSGRCFIAHEREQKEAASRQSREAVVFLFFFSHNACRGQQVESIGREPGKHVTIDEGGASRARYRGTHRLGLWRFRQALLAALLVRQERLSREVIVYIDESGWARGEREWVSASSLPLFQSIDARRSGCVQKRKKTDCESSRSCAAGDDGSGVRFVWHFSLTSAARLRPRTRSGDITKRE